MLIFIITLSCSILYNPININASSIDTSTNNLVMNNNLDYDDELMGFLNIQDQITKTLSLKDGKYVYDMNKIREIVYAYDFTGYNKKYHTSWTNKSFFETAITNVREFRDTNKFNGSN